MSPHNKFGELKICTRANIIANILGYVLAVAFLVLWLLRLVPYETQWGSVGEWASAIFTGGGLLFAGISARAARDALVNDRIRRDKEDELRKTTTRNNLVLKCEWETFYGGRVGMAVGRASYHIKNTSAHPFFNCKIEFTNETENSTHDHYCEDLEVKLSNEFGQSKSFNAWYQAKVVGTLLPGEELRGDINIYNKYALPGWDPDKFALPALYFTDVWGLSWKRDRSTTGWILGQEIPRENPICMCCE